MDAMEGRKAVIVGISGCSSSGKTTLARLLRDIFPSSFILHQDDFYKPEAEHVPQAQAMWREQLTVCRLPVRDGLVDWDCPQAISIPDMEQSLVHIRSTGTFPPDLDSKEDQNSVGKCPVSDVKIEAMKAKVQAWLQPGNPGHTVLGIAGLKICLLDGFLLYCPQMQPIMDLIDIKLFLLVSRAKATQRREARDGYVTLEGFWTDPPGYVDKIVWPNYAEVHKWLFEDGNVEGQPSLQAFSEKGIQAQLGRGLDIDLETMFEWTVDTILRELERFC